MRPMSEPTYRTGPHPRDAVDVPDADLTRELDDLRAQERDVVAEDHGGGLPSQAQHRLSRIRERIGDIEDEQQRRTDGRR